MNVARVTQMEMVKLSGLDRGMISRYLTGVQIPRLSTAMYISDVCKLPISIFTDKDVQLVYFGRIFLKHDVSYKKREV